MAPDRPGDSANAMFEEYAPIREGGEAESRAAGAPPAARKSAAGRKPRDEYVKVTLTLSKRLNDCLDAAAFLERRSRSSIVEDMVREPLLKYAGLVEEMKRMKGEREGARGK